MFGSEISRMRCGGGLMIGFLMTGLEISNSPGLFPGKREGSYGTFSVYAP
jgi:hypothetical protein